MAVSARSAGGLVTISVDGLLLTYTPVANFAGTETFTYTLGDGTTASTVTATVTLTVTP